ncbi:MAG: rRNA maturation RNase YbeY [Actinomycetia bacterium]|nr:rRNA maturation RNase YbeY [Actinomycetes bacterium]
MTVEITNPGGAPIDDKTICGLAEFLLANVGMGTAVELSVSFVAEPQMAELHERWLDLPGPTDVLSFPMDELTEPVADELVQAGILGDIVICWPVAERQAEQAGHSTQAEVEVLLTHGVLHLLGNDHAEPEEATRMFARQAALLEQYRERLPG